MESWINKNITPINNRLHHANTYLTLDAEKYLDTGLNHSSSGSSDLGILT